MKKSKRVVIGKYRNPEDVKATLQRLERDGYTRDDVSLYSNNKNLKKFEENNDVDMLADETKTVKDTNNESFLDKIKHMVSYDNEEDTNFDDNEKEMLEPYRDDIKDGYTVVAFRERENTSVNAQPTKVNEAKTDLYETNAEMPNAEVTDVPTDNYKPVDVSTDTSNKKNET
ncbi:MAG TPA: general stress protein, partial [Atopostipes sp.]|nr:general stress protein [Atopostipes sp.]